MEKIRYIQYRYEGQLETIDELPFNTRQERKEFYRVLKEYQTSMPYAEIYKSQRCCKSWND